MPSERRPPLGGAESSLRQVDPGVPKNWGTGNELHWKHEEVLRKPDTMAKDSYAAKPLHSMTQSAQGPATKGAKQAYVCPNHTAWETTGIPGYRFELVRFHSQEGRCLRWLAPALSAR